MDPGFSGSDLFRSKWPYPVGMVAGSIFGIAAVALTYQLMTPSSEGPPSKLPMLAMAASAAALCVAWAGLLKTNQGGFGAVLGSLALALGIAYFASQEAGFDNAGLLGVVLFGSFAGFALGHAFAQSTILVRILGAAVGLLLLFLLVANQQKMSFGVAAATAAVGLVTGGLGLLGLAIAHAFYELSRMRPSSAV